MCRERTTVSQPVGELDTLRECVNVPDLSREGPFDIHRDRLHSDASPRSCQDNQGCPFCITSYDLEIDGSDFVRNMVCSFMIRVFWSM